MKEELKRELAQVPPVPDDIFPHVMARRKSKVIHFLPRAVAALLIFAVVMVWNLPTSNELASNTIDDSEWEVVYSMDDISSYDILSDL